LRAALKRGILGPEKHWPSNTDAFRAFALPPFPGGACSNAGRRARAKEKENEKKRKSLLKGPTGQRPDCAVVSQWSAKFAAPAKGPA